jgi:hypothetical protein
METLVAVVIAGRIFVVEIISERAVALHLDPEGDETDDGPAIIWTPAEA